MNCKMKSSIELLSNIGIKGKEREFVPVDILYPEGRVDNRVLCDLTQSQREQADKILYYATRIVEDKTRFRDMPENEALCADCEDREHCY